MKYSQQLPHPSLASYIDAYWTATGAGVNSSTERILPDGCVDIILNPGEDCLTDNGKFLMQSGKVYLVGTMTDFKETRFSQHTHLLGIRFKPGAFPAFYKFASLHEFTNQTIESDKAVAPDLQQVIKNPADYLNRFFGAKLSSDKSSMLPVIDEIQRLGGQIKVEALAKMHFTTVRQLERNFKQHLGISPKEYIKLVRYQSAHSLIQDKRFNRSLSDIAFECGYSDHAHLTNEIKRYTGLTPSQL